MESVRVSELYPVKIMFTWMQRVHFREQLRSLTDHTMRDIGLNRYEVKQEISKPFWRA